MAPVATTAMPLTARAAVMMSALISSSTRGMTSDIRKDVRKPGPLYRSASPEIWKAAA